MVEKNDGGGNDGQIINIGCYQVSSREEISRDEFGLVRGDGLMVLDEEGNVLYENLRGFMPLGDKKHLLRYSDGVWVILNLAQGKFRKMKKVNLSVGDEQMMFDERGKLHLNQMSPYYQSISA